MDGQAGLRGGWHCLLMPGGWYARQRAQEVRRRYTVVQTAARRTAAVLGAATGRHGAGRGQLGPSSHGPCGIGGLQDTGRTRASVSNGGRLSLGPLKGALYGRADGGRTGCGAARAQAQVRRVLGDKGGASTGARLPDADPDGRNRRRGGDRGDLWAWGRGSAWARFKYGGCGGAAADHVGDTCCVACVLCAGKGAGRGWWCGVV